MSCPYKDIHVHANFIDGTGVDSPPISIFRPVNMEPHVGSVDGFNTMLEKLRSFIKNIPPNKDDWFFFHSKKFDYYLSLNGYPGGCVFGLIQPREDGDCGVKSLKNNSLIPIRNASEFHSCLKNTGEIVNKTGRTRGQTLKSIHHVNIELAFVLKREYIPVDAREPKKRPTGEVLPLSLSSDNTANHKRKKSAKSSDTSKSKKKKAKGKKFKARSLKISMSAPLLNHESKNDKFEIKATQGIPEKILFYELDNWITDEPLPSLLPGSTQSVSSELSKSDDSSISSVTTPDGDERFKLVFTLGQFCHDIMKMVINEFKEVYDPSKKAIGPSSNLYIKLKLSSNTWTIIENKKSLHTILYDQMEKPKRVDRGGALFISLAFGTALLGSEFSSREDANNYLEDESENGALHFTSEKGAPPKVTRIGEALRNYGNNRANAIDSLVMRLYRTEGCKFHYAFLQEHIPALVQIISGNLASMKDKSPFQKCIEDCTVPSDDDIELHISLKYQNQYRNQVKGNLLPKTDEYPPIDPSMVKAPPTRKAHEERNKKKQRSINLLDDHPVIAALGVNSSALAPTSMMGLFTPPTNRSSFPHFKSYSTPDSFTSNSPPSSKSGKKVGITFKKYDGTAEDESVMVPNHVLGLNMESKMEDLLQHAEIETEFSLGNIQKCRFLIETNDPDNKYFTQRYKFFKDMTVSGLTEIEHVKTPYQIHVK